MTETQTSLTGLSVCPTCGGIGPFSCVCNPVPLPCPVCHDQFVIAVAGPDSFGNYDTDDCPCQLDPDFDPANYEDDDR